MEEGCLDGGGQAGNPQKNAARMLTSYNTAGCGQYGAYASTCLGVGGRGTDLTPSACWALMTTVCTLRGTIAPPTFLYSHVT